MTRVWVVLVPSNVTGFSIVLPQAPCNMGSHCVCKQYWLAGQWFLLRHLSHLIRLQHVRPNPIIPMVSVRWKTLKVFDQMVLGQSVDASWRTPRY